MTPPKDAGVAVQAQQDSVPARKLAAAMLAITAGTVLEWYDYSIYTQLSKVLSAVFFPSDDAALQALSFWGVYAVGFLSRPAGAVLFGQIGDTRGRGVCLLISILVMGIPTVLMGCLPTYAQAGYAAPVLLAVLRLVQGLAMGGEFGAAMTFMYELAHSRHKALISSVGYVSLGLGVVLGILVVNAVISTLPGAALLRWGWRVPFLAASVSLVAGVVLRFNMPETAEFATSHEQMEVEFQARLQQQQQQQRRKQQQQKDHQSLPLPLPQLTRAAAGAPAAGGVAPQAAAAAAAADEACATHGTASARHYVPLVQLFREHWLGLLLHVCYAAWNAAAFHLAYSWLPSFFVQQVGISTQLSMWMLLSCMVLFTAVVPVAGALSDRGLPRVTTNIVVCAVSGVLYVPTFLAFSTRSVAACWTLQALHLALAAWAMGVLPAIVCRIYPAGVRISGFNLAHNMGATIGGVTPLIITALQAATGAVFLAPAVFMSGMAVSSLVGSLLLIKFKPATNQVP